MREEREEVIQRLKLRGLDAQVLVDKVLTLDEERRKAQAALDATLQELNSISREIGTLMRSGQKEEAEKAKFRTRELKEDEKRWKDALSTAETDQDEALVQLPNAPHASVPFGKSAEDNEVVATKGRIEDYAGKSKPHWELVSTHNLISFEQGTSITGAGFPLYRGWAARLQRVLINYFLDKATAAGYVEHQPPILVNAASAFATGQLPDKEGQMYHIPLDDLYLIPTAEVPLTNIYRDTIVDKGDLPIMLTGYTPCFRREAGSYGKDVRGLNRLHQFDKVELVQITEPERSYPVLEEMRAHVASLLDELELPYRILKLCGGDMGFTSALTYDFEVWSGAQERWLEVSSVSNFEDFQANRLKLRYRTDEGTRLLHTLNGSALALPRIVAALLENFQTDTGIGVPQALEKYGLKPYQYSPLSAS